MTYLKFLINFKNNYNTIEIDMGNCSFLDVMLVDVNGRNNNF